MEAYLLAELRHKLTYLDRKVLDYQQQTLNDFHEYYHNLIRDCDPSLIAKVDQSLLPTLAEFQSLRPSLPSHESRRVPPSHSAPASPAEVAFQPPSPPAAITTSTSARERESELGGIFTPTYLPLLEADPIPSRTAQLPRDPDSSACLDSILAKSASLNGTTPTDQQPSGVAPQQPAGASNSATMLQAGEVQGDRATSDSLLSIRPNHERRSTDDTTSSIVSEGSTPQRRSALRRSSSASKTPQSPRRVRFEVMGTEVLPTASPRNSELPTPRPSSPSTSESRSMFDDDDEQPPPRKISSSEALRALSRAPMEGTVWTVVNPDSDDASFEQTSSRPTTPQSPVKVEDSQPSESMERPSASPGQISSSNLQEGVQDDIDEDDDAEEESSDDEFLSMAKPKSFSNKKFINTTLAVSSSPSSETPAASSSEARKDANSRSNGNWTKSGRAKIDDDELEDPFHFEMGGLSAPPRPKTQTRLAAPLMDDHDFEEERQDENSTQETAGAVLSSSATSSAVPISRNRPPATPATPTRTHFQVGSVGSYKGKPIIMPIVCNPDLHAQAESLGDFDTFVGGLDGKSGVDEGNMNSFRASFKRGSAFSGTPMSMTERFLREEMEEELKKDSGGR